MTKYVMKNGELVEKEEPRRRSKDFMDALRDAEPYSFEQMLADQPSFRTIEVCAKIGLDPHSTNLSQAQHEAVAAAESAYGSATLTAAFIQKYRRVVW